MNEYEEKVLGLLTSIDNRLASLQKVAIAPVIAKLKNKIKTQQEPTADKTAEALQSIEEEEVQFGAGDIDGDS